MNLSITRRAVLTIINICVIFIITTKNLCVARIIPRGTTPWMVLIQTPNLFDDSSYDDSSYEYHCAGVLIEQDIVVTSAKCLDKLPKNSQMVLFAGSATSRLDWTNGEIQKYLPFGVQSVTNKIVSISISPPVHRTKYVDYIATCKGQNCSFGDKFGYQYGWDLSIRYNDNLQMVQYDFSDSSELCLELNESPENKYCTHFSCNGDKNKNYGGEPLTKVYKGQSYLMGFWDYDLCGYQKDVRIFQKFSYDEPITDVDNKP